MTTKEIDEALLFELLNSYALSLHDLCLFVARHCIEAEESPPCEKDIRQASRGMAIGLFGESYDRANEGLRKAWEDACESAMREAIKERRKAMH